MPRIQCAICSNTFYAKPSHIAKGWARYCSKNCQYKGQSTGSMLPCNTCGKPTYKTLTDLRRSKSKLFFCSNSCQTSWRNTRYSGIKHSNWTTGESSYRQILGRADIPKECCKCHTKDTRILAVHHKDKNRDNNTLVNLMWLCHNCHYLVHHYEDESVGFLGFIKLKRNTRILRDVKQLSKERCSVCLHYQIYPAT